VPAGNAALLIDFDNVTMGIRSDLQTQLRRLLNSEIIKGKVAVQRAYADWRRYPQYIVPLSEASIDLIFAPAFGSNKKNATDIRLAIDALELVFTRPEIGVFILLSGDSDFSSLVLKLKEYGKYIIGVGIRESSSDLLIQNCDEYYAYTEITGLQREGDVVVPRRDPWELVIEAVTQMKRENDVMRSDRLKQVMQSIDPEFDEKDAGFSRFSKFVQEAQARGLLAVHKLDNGQFGVDIGDNANVHPDEAAALAEAPPAAKEARRGSRRRTEPRRGADDAKQLTLAEGFELLRQALLVLGATGENAVDADNARVKMLELTGEDGDPLFQRPRFQRFLRQAHDANLVEVTKGDEGYRLRLAAGAEVRDLQSPALSAAAEAVTAEPAGDERPARPRGTRRGGRGRGRRAGRDAAAETGEAPAARAATAVAERTLEPAPERPSPSAPTLSAGDQAAHHRNPRFRRGSRGATRATAPPPQTPFGAPAGGPPQASSPGRYADHGAGSVGPRRGGRPGAPPRGGEAERTAEAAETAQRDGAKERAEPAHAAETAGAAERTAAVSSADSDDSAGGFLKRVTAALQKAVRGPDVKPDR
jgi:uncharacterized protein (TIGR00288 family)